MIIISVISSGIRKKNNEISIPAVEFGDNERDENKLHKIGDLKKYIYI